jgi:hypothetical protein
MSVARAFHMSTVDRHNAGSPVNTNTQHHSHVATAEE